VSRWYSKTELSTVIDDLKIQMVRLELDGERSQSEAELMIAVVEDLNDLPEKSGGLKNVERMHAFMLSF